MMRFPLFAVLAAALACQWPHPAAAQFSTVINIPPDAAPGSIGPDTQLNLFEGGALPAGFIAGIGSANTNVELNIFGGEVGEQSNAFPGTTVNLHGGMIMRQFDAYQSNVNISGGRVGDHFNAADSVVNITGGIVDPFFSIRGNTQLNLSGGTIGPDFVARTGTSVQVSGGVIGSWNLEPDATAQITGGNIGPSNIDGALAIRGGTFGSFGASHTSQIEIFGGEFRLNGLPIAGLETPGSTVPYNLLPRNTLSGTLADGTPFAFSSWNQDIFASGTLRLTAAPLPPIGPAQILASVGPVPLGIRQGQTLVVDSGASLGANFNVGRGGVLRVPAGGSVGAGLEITGADAYVSGGSVVNAKIYDGGNFHVAGGNVGSVIADGASRVEMSGGQVNFVDVTKGSLLTISGGQLTNGFNAHEKGRVEMLGGSIGSIGNIARALSRSSVEVAGGDIRAQFEARSASNVVIRGGNFGGAFLADAGSNVTVAGGTFAGLFNQAGAGLQIRGNEFLLNGTPISGLGEIGSSQAVTLHAGGIVSGVLEDGTPFAFSSSVGEDSITAVTLVATELPAVGPALIDLPALAAPAGIRAGQTLRVQAGGLLPGNFNAGRGSTLQIYPGGSALGNLEATGATVELVGGAIGNDFDAFAGTTVNVLSGSVGSSFAAHSGSIVNLHGGTFGSLLRATEGSTLKLFGTEFLLDGQPIEGLQIGQPFLFTARTGVLSGRFADDSSFSLPFRTTGRGEQQLISLNARVILTVVPEPAGALLFAVALFQIAVALRWRR